MTSVVWFRSLRRSLLVLLLCQSFAADLFAERVGFEFSGKLLGGPANITLFGVEAPGNSNISGTFSYDTTVAGTAGPEIGSLDFVQQITGGFSIDVGTVIHLSASEYFVEVTDNFEIDDGEFVDVFSMQFARPVDGALHPLLKRNGEPYLGTGFFQVGFTWPSETFEGPNEPQLTSARPVEDELARGSFGFIGPQSGFVFVVSSIVAITSPLGDYNRNGVVDVDDYSEWKSEYGGSLETALFADGNGDQRVDAADYTVWRDNLAFNTSQAAKIIGAVPEPSATALIVVIPWFSSLSRCRNLRFAYRILNSCR